MLPSPDFRLLRVHIWHWPFQFQTRGQTLIQTGEAIFPGRTTAREEPNKATEILSRIVFIIKEELGAWEEQRRQKGTERRERKGSWGIRNDLEEIRNSSEEENCGLFTLGYCVQILNFFRKTKLLRRKIWKWGKRKLKKARELQETS